MIFAMLNKGNKGKILQTQNEATLLNDGCQFEFFRRVFTSVVQRRHQENEEEITND